MACRITVNPLIGQETVVGQGITMVTASGTVPATATNCSTVQVQVLQTQPVDVSTPEKTATVTNGSWSVDFTVAANDFPPGTFLCGSGNKYTVVAKCTNSSGCEGDDYASNYLTCNCPQVDILVTPGDCVHGRRTVHFKAEVVGSGDATYTWFFGTDEDNQPNEDSQAGDGSGNTWLPAPTNGIRVVETDHVYEPTSNQSQTITARLVTSSGPTSTICEGRIDFVLESCECAKTAVRLQVSDQAGREYPSRECLPPGDYIVEVVSPTGNGIVYSWSVNGLVDNSQNGSTFSFSILAGEEKTISVVVEQGGCESSNGVTIRRCEDPNDEDCTGFETRLRILDRNRRDVTDRECLPPGNYTVRATLPPGDEITPRWMVNNVEDATAAGTTLAVTLRDNEQIIVTLEARLRECHDINTVVLRACPPPVDSSEDVSIPCLLFKVLALLGLGLVFVGAVLLLCPAIAILLPAPATFAIGIGLVIEGAFLLALGLSLWLFICRPDRCDWLAFLWQSLVLLGLVLIYAGFCPGCSWMLLGIVPLLLGIGASILWERNCNVTRCRVLIEWITLFTFVVNVVAFLEMVLGMCVIISQPIAAGIWALMIAAIQAWLWFEANRQGCING